MTLLSAHRWCEILQINILDPDGWRLGDGVTMDTPISGDDFLQRLGVSTISMLPAPDKDFSELLESYLKNDL